MTRLGELLYSTAESLNALAQPWALVGGLAVSVRTEPRFTRDIDLVVAVGGDEQAEQLIHAFQANNFEIKTAIEQEKTGRLATVRLASTQQGTSGIVVDLLFASSGIEPEIVDNAEITEVLPGVTVPVAQIGHLIALKVLSRAENRPQDNVDLHALTKASGPADKALAVASARLIDERGYGRGRDLPQLVSQLFESNS